MKNFSFLAIVSAGLLLSSCANKDQIEKVLLENPEILTKVFEKHPDKILESLQKAANSMKTKMAEQRDEEEKKKLEEAYNNPLKPKIRPDESIRGTAGAPLVLVEYSDFQCPFCTRAFGTVQELLEKYKGKIQFIYKHLPLSFHPQARLASEYYEAIRLQDTQKAFSFHDKIYEDISKLKDGKKFLDSLAKSVGANMGKLASDITSEKVKARIDEDLKEAAEFDFQGTPGFLINGIPVKGAYPADHFDGIIEELKKTRKSNNIDLFQTILRSQDERRKILLDEMILIQKSRLPCQGCSGVCCTYQKNSMKITPLEAYDLAVYISSRIDSLNIIKKLKECISTFRLNSFSIGNGKRDFLRRSYTCPFFLEKEFGCCITKTAKPYGCLGFNQYGKENEGESCSSNLQALRNRDFQFSGEDEFQEKLRDFLKISWTTNYIPNAVLDIIESERFQYHQIQSSS